MRKTPFWHVSVVAWMHVAGILTIWMLCWLQPVEAQSVLSVNPSEAEKYILTRFASPCIVDANHAEPETEKSEVEPVVVFAEDYEAYSEGILGSVPGTKWVRHASSRTGEVTSNWVHGGTKNFQTASFLFSTEINYALLELEKMPHQLNLELWYTPDGFFIYDDFAKVGLASVQDKATMTDRVHFSGQGQSILYKTQSMAAGQVVYDQLIAGSGPAPSGTPVHTYIRVEFDFKSSEARFFIGPDASAPLSSKAYLDSNLEINALFISGGLNPTFIDDIRITTLTEPEYALDAGVTDMELPNMIRPGTSVPIGVIVGNFGTSILENIPVNYQINASEAIREILPGPINPGATMEKVFSSQWSPATEGDYVFSAWTSLPGDERPENDTLTPSITVVASQGVTNSPPVMSEISDQIMIAGQTLVIPVSATDEDSDELYFSIPQNPGFLLFEQIHQSGLTTNANLVLSPPFTFTGNFQAIIRVSDGKGGFDTKEFSVEVVTASKGNWTFQNPLENTSVTSNTLYAVFFLDNHLGWASGRYGTLLKTTNGGMTWSLVTTPYAYINTSIFFVDSQHGWIGQSSGKILKTIDGGESWEQITTPVSRAIQRLFFIDAMTGWAAGGGSIGGYIMKTTDGGSTWAQQSIPEGPAINDVYFINHDDGWAAGMNGRVYQTNNGGNTWTAQNTGRTDWFEKIWFHNETIGFIAGSEGILKTTNGGSDYSLLNTGFGWIDYLAFFDEFNGMATGAKGSTLSKSIDGSGEITFTGGAAKTWITDDGGSDWDENIPSVGGWIVDACFTDRNNGWGVGKTGMIIKYSNTLPIPAQPTNLQAAYTGNNTIALTWSDNATTETGFEVHRSEAIAGNFSFLSRIDANTTNYSDNGLTPETPYWYRIRAVNAIGSSASSLEAFAITEQQSFDLSLEALPPDFGTVNGAGKYHPGDVVAISAIPATGNKFKEWLGETGFPDNPKAASTTLTMPAKSLHLTANFEEAYCIITVLTEPPSGGTVLGAGTFREGCNIHLQAVPNPNHIFQRWTENGNELSILPDLEFIATHNRTITAHFQSTTDASWIISKKPIVYPNPASDDFFIYTPDNQPVLQIEVFDMTGRRFISIRPLEADQYMVDTSQLPGGIYFVRIMTLAGSQAAKLQILKKH